MHSKWPSRLKFDSRRPASVRLSAMMGRLSVGATGHSCDRFAQVTDVTCRHSDASGLPGALRFQASGTIFMLSMAASTSARASPKSGAARATLSSRWSTSTVASPCT